jgi:uncharacterized cupredoxin-like copper-binding protein
MAGIRIKTGRSLLAAGAMLLLLFGCAGDPPTPPAARVLDVNVRDFKIEPSLPTTMSGRVELRVRNAGPATHEFVVVRSDLPADQLPIAADGLSVDEDQVAPVGELDEVEAGATGTLTVALAPGHYVLFCNLEGHYLVGMSASIEVTDDV